MKTRKTELDLDFIGGQERLTIAEENAISDYFKKRKWTPVRRLAKTLRVNRIEVK